MRDVRHLLAMVFLMCSACSPRAADPTSAAGTLANAPSPMARRIVDLVNQQRVSARLEPLTSNTKLYAAAQIQAQQMAHAGRMEHVLPGERYPTPTDRVDAVGYDWKATAENIAVDQDSAAQAVTRWMGSTSHRHNILNPTYTETGAGYYRDANGHRYYVQVFGLPRSH